MDIARPSNTRQKQRRRIMYGAIAFVMVGVITLTLSKPKAAAPSVERSIHVPSISFRRSNGARRLTARSGLLAGGKLRKGWPPTICSFR